MTTDWKAALSQLAGDLPADAQPTTPANEESAEHNAGNHSATPIIGHLKRAHFSYERKGRGGKPATIIYGLDHLSQEQVKDLAAELKRTLAVGGSTRDNEILLQGDCRQRLMNLIG